MLSVLWSKKSRAILEFRQCLGKSLLEEYGESKRYTKEQVSFIVATRHPKYINYLVYALAMFLWKEDFDKYNESLDCPYLIPEIEKDIKFNISEENDKSALGKNSSVSGSTCLR